MLGVNSARKRMAIEEKTTTAPPRGQCVAVWIQVSTTALVSLALVGSSGLGEPVAKELLWLWLLWLGAGSRGLRGCTFTASVMVEIRTGEGDACGRRGDLVGDL